jgi:hypothetical protein
MATGKCLGPYFRGFNNRKNLEKKVILAEMCNKTRRLLVFGQIGKIYEAKQSAKREVQVN